MKNFRKAQRGITLIALVITIVILIILATISINFVFNGGLIDRAEQARDYYQNDEAYTDESITNLTGYIDGLINGVEGGGTSGAKTLVQAFNDGKINVGDYVNYQAPTTGSYTADATDTGMDNAGVEGVTDQVFEVSKNELTWRVLGIDEETGGLKLIAGSPMKSNNVIEGEEVPYLFMYGAKAYTNGVNILKGICGLYKNDTYAEDARSVNMDDINQITGITTPDDIKRVNLDPVMNNGYQYGDPYEYVSDEYNSYYTPESWLNGKQPTTVSGTVNGYMYAINAPEEFPYPSVNLSDTRAYDMLFDNVEPETGKAYWLASVGVYADSGDAGFGPGVVGAGDGVTNAGTYYAFASGGYEYDRYAAVRPVVILKSNITLDQIQVIEDQTEEEWNIGG